MSVNALSQKEYLKKYLSSGSDDKKKKKKKKNSKSTDDRFRIVDDDIDIKNMRPLDDDEVELYNLAEDAPQIAGIIDERPEEVRRLEEFGTKRWKVVADEDGIDDVKITAIDLKPATTKKPKYNGSSEVVSDRSNSKKKDSLEKSNSELDYSTATKKNSRLSRTSENYSDADISPPRGNWKKSVNRSDNDSDTSPPRKGQKSLEVRMPSKEIMKFQEKPHEEYSGKLKKLQSETEKVQHTRKYDSDESPPRKSRKSGSGEYTVQRSRNRSDSDVSPPRRSNRLQDSDESPPRKVRKDVIDRSSPQRARKPGADESPPRRSAKYRRSPIEQRERQHMSDESPPRKMKHQTSNHVRPKKQYTEEHSAQRSRYHQGSEQSPYKKHKQQIPGGSTEGSSKHRESPSRSTKRYNSPSRVSKNHSDISGSSQRKNTDHYNVEKGYQNSVKKHDSESVRNKKFGQKSPAKMFYSRNERSKSPESRSNQKGIGSDSSSKFIKDNADHSHKGHGFEKPHSRHKDTNSMNRQHNRHSVSPARNYEDPSRWKHRQNSPCRRNKSDDDSDASPPRKYSQAKSSKKSFETECQETRPTKTRDRFPERNRNDSKDTSHRKVKQDGSHDAKSRRENSDARNSPGRPKKGNSKMLDGMKAGLQSKEELKKEIQDFQEREREMFAQLDPSVSGEGVSAILRDRRTGKRRNLEQEARDREEQQIAEAEQKSKYSRWGRGLKQVEDQTEKLKEDLYEMSKPLARYADDADLERHLRDQEREGDPMLDYIRNKKKEAGVKEKPKYQGSYLPNRFGIPPGHRWDGVDRSSGYEKKWFEELNARRAREEEAYKWSTSDM